MRNKGNPIYSKGDVVYAPLFRDNKQLVIRKAFHNNFVWMYSFENDEACMGEHYLCRRLPEKSLRELIIQSIDNLKSIDRFSPNTMRWANSTFQGKHVSEIQYDKLKDSELLDFYTIITIQLYKQY